MATHEGKITKLGDRNSGFLKRVGEKEELFFDGSDLIGISFKELRIGDKLSFIITKSLKGPYATSVSKIVTGKSKK